jgi:hypothetical protein
VTERRDVGVKACPDILYVEDERVQVFQVFRFRAARLAVKRINGQARLLVFRVGDFFIHQPADSMLWRKKRDEPHALSFIQNIYRLTTCAIASRVIRYKANSHPRKLLEIVTLKHVNPRQDFSINGRVQAHIYIRPA